MKSIETALGEVSRHLWAGWHLDAAGAGHGRWPKSIPLGTISSAQADIRYTEVQAWAHAWHIWVNGRDVTLCTRTRRIRGIEQTDVPTHVVFGDVDEAAAAVSDGWPARLRLARRRAELVGAAFPSADSATVLRLAAHLDDVNFELAFAAARWFADNPDVWPGLTPRQVPVAGLHAKWLDTHKPLVKALAGLDELNLAERGTRIYWTYLDPGYRRTGGRIHDSMTLGDSVVLPYQPSIVLIVENKDTAILFPEMARAVVVEGNGNAAVGLLPQVPWIARAEAAIYWGDIDARGYEIVNGLRAHLPQIRTVLMDSATYEKYSEFGTRTDERGLELKPRKRLALPHLSETERAVYLNVTDPEWTRHRRFEQERIPLPVAHTHVRAAVTRIIGHTDDSPACGSG